MNNNVIFLPNKTVNAVGHYKAQECELVDIELILRNGSFTEERIVGYFSNHGPYRYNNKHALYYRMQKINIAMTHMIVDVDTHPHEPWKDLENGLKIMTHFAEKFKCHAYLTNRGFRIIFKLPVPITYSEYAHYSERIIKMIQQSFIGEFGGLSIDKSSCEWDKLYIAPRLGSQYSYISENYELREDNVFSEIPKLSSSLIQQKALNDITLKSIQKTLGIDIFNILAEGRPFFGPGQRNSEVYKLLKKLRKNPDISAADAVAFLTPSLSAHTDGTPFEKSMQETIAAAERIWENSYKAPDMPNFDLPLFCYNDKSYFILDAENETYLQPISNGPLVAPTLEKFCARLQPQVYSDEGKYVPLPYLTKAYGQLVQWVDYRLGESTCTVDKENLRLTVGTCGKKELEPEFNPEIDGWLKQIGGDNYEKLLDWLATFRQIDTPTSVLYLKGTSGIGKGMLANALASFFGQVPLTFREISQRFNARIAVMPFWWLDEGEIIDKNISPGNTFKKISGNTMFSAEVKHGAVISIYGCTRGFISANNLDALPLWDMKTKEDLISIGERIFYIECNDEAVKKYLEDIGGYSYTKSQGWVEKNLICKHIAWLEQNRTVTPGPRFIVTGHQTMWHEKMMMSKFKKECFTALLLAYGKKFNWITEDAEYIYFIPKELHASWITLIGKNISRSIQDLKESFVDYSDNVIKKMGGHSVRVIRMTKTKLQTISELMDIKLVKEDDDV